MRWMVVALLVAVGVAAGAQTSDVATVEAAKKKMLERQRERAARGELPATRPATRATSRPATRSVAVDDVDAGHRVKQDAPKWAKNYWIEFDRRGPELREKMNGLRKDLAKARSKSEKEKLQQKIKDLDALIASGSPPMVKLEMDSAGGPMHPDVEVMQVIDGKNMLALLYFTQYERVGGTKAGQSFGTMRAAKMDDPVWIKGIDTAGRVDDQIARDIFQGKILRVSGTKTYDTGGGTRTVFIIEPCDPQAWLDR